MEQYRIDETLLDTNGAYTYFTVFGNSYPVKAICRDNIQILELDDDFRTNDGKLKLKKIFNTQNKNNLLFFDNRENTVRNPVKINLREQVLNNNPLEIKNIILYGSPGVGKTHNTNKLISLIENNQDEKEIFASIKENKKETIILDDKLKSRVKFITFHQSFGYEDFIEGFRPNEDGNITLVPGIFKEICNKARKDLNNKYYLVIDEINRGNISKIFGELITLIEEDKRDNFEVTLPYSKEPFKIPSNLFIIGTMNSTDKSIALIDIALRRRFTFLKMKPNEDLITHPKSKAIFKSLNLQIIEDLGQDYQLGHSYFMKINSNEDLWFVLEYKIKPLLEEYYYGDNDRLKVIDDIISNI
jgi:5-methylcytosine-specific restriction protein B